jgi:hypothetical protein
VRAPYFQDLPSYDVALADIDVDGDLDIVTTLIEPGPSPRLTWYENRIDDGGPWNEARTSPLGVVSRQLLTADFDRDGDPDFVSTDGSMLLQSWINGGGQFALATTDVAPAAIEEGFERAVFAVEVRHRGRAGEAALELDALAFLFEESFGSPLTDAQLAAVVETLRLYRDDGSGTFNSADDTAVASFPAPSLDAGLSVLPLPSDAGLRHQPAETPVTYFLTVELTPDATAEGLDSLRISHVPARGSTARNADHGTPLMLEHSGEVTASFTIVAPLFTDGFESGDTSAWSQ